MKPGLKIAAAPVLALVVAVALGELGLPTVFADANSRLLGALLAAGLAGLWGTSPRERLACAAAAATTCAILARAPLPFLGLGALDLGYGRWGEHALFTLPLTVLVAVALFADAGERIAADGA